MTESVVQQEMKPVGEQTIAMWHRLVMAGLAGLLALGCYLYFVVHRGFVEVELEVTELTDFKVYWAEPGMPYAEVNMNGVHAHPGRTSYTLSLTDLRRIDRLRIDTHRYAGTARLMRLKISQEGLAPIVLQQAEDFARLQPLDQIKDVHLDGDVLVVESTGEDPNFELIFSPQTVGIDPLGLGVRLAAIFIIVGLLVYPFTLLLPGLRFVPLLLFGIWLLIFAMAGVSERNAHPDEYVHLDAIAYYQDHWLPPLFEDPEIRHTYSVYGVSRLNNGEVYYLFAGKFKALLNSFHLPDHLAARFFNVLLFGLIVIYAIANHSARLAAVPLLITPQIWYVFSYCGSDAFALFITFLAGVQLLDSGSLLHRYLLGEKPMARLLGLAGIGLLLGALFLLKKNYYPFIAFFYLCLAVKLMLVPDFFWERREIIIRLLLVTLIGLGFFGLRKGADYAVNGFDQSERLERLEEELANPLYKPSTPLEEKHTSLYRKSRGTSLYQLITEDNWFEQSFRSGFGVYGYFTSSGPFIYYDLVRWTATALLGFVVFSILFRGGLAGNLVMFGGGGLALALIAASLHHSWTMDFQAQGRYLFPIVPILSVLFGWNHRAINRSVVVFGVVLLFLLSVYSFIFIGLVHIAKVPL